jgi:acyl-coenzyme A thioesterase PaaI-like protein
LQSANMERDHLNKVGQGKAHGEISESPGTYTAYMNIEFKRPVRTPGVLMATARTLKREGRKEWIYAEIKQREGVAEDDEGEEVVCATARNVHMSA